MASKATVPSSLTELFSYMLDMLNDQKGYKETGINKTKYNRYFDVEAWQFFNTKKQGAEWCATFVIWAFVQVLLPIFGGSFAKIRSWFGMPSPKNNEAAGCRQFWSYMAKKKWKVGKKEGKVLDIIFFGECGHVGIITGVDANNYYTLEGNVHNQVSACKYSKTNTYIYGIMHPDWDSIAKLLPNPEPVQLPANYRVRVSATGYLSLREKPNAGAILGRLYNNAIVTVYEISDHYARVCDNTDEMWCDMQWLEKIT